MARPKPTTQDLRDRRERARAWKEFRRNYCFTQKRLADMVNISRRTIQQIEAGKITPHPDTIRTFVAFKKKHERQAKVETYS